MMIDMLLVCETHLHDLIISATRNP